MARLMVYSAMYTRKRGSMYGRIKCVVRRRLDFRAVSTGWLDANEVKMPLGDSTGDIDGDGGVRSLSVSGSKGSSLGEGGIELPWSV